MDSIPEDAMTVGDLKVWLADIDPDLPVIVSQTGIICDSYLTPDKLFVYNSYIGIK